jgi:hypothetical protein
MQKSVGWAWIVGFLGLLAAADAQTPPPSTFGTQFDGTYVFVSAARVNETYTTTRTHRIGQCAENLKVGPLTVVNGQARYSSPGRLTAAGFEGTVGSQGELAMRLASTPGTRGAGASPGIEITTRGRLDGNGTVSARQMGYLCSYDVIWRKQSK